ncbi:cobalt-nickel-resistance system protein [Sulfuriferula plumbiphila]|uniref:Cobalt-nickel-resistance system protein n=1 Tax=Sulfuriferula plumbiphila TaxID=171865 RepID=A0A512L6Q1_9PROT|nr:DMT family transporter [Sulfuriferula plumbiphila]BBP04883.1 cobalt-nickel-resistance system protein [Sulfuriferula plumbiphila]GEP30156.1 cobalt-nickel-resistance system protein [Sulfuriferula plumbiphila]
MRIEIHKGIIQALAAAILFGISTPMAKALVGATHPLILAGLLYLGSGLGLAAWRWLRRLPGKPVDTTPLLRQDLPWLAGTVLAGGVLAPALLMWGLQFTQGSTASLLLNLEGVLTALLAWFVFHENFDRRIALGMLLIVTAGALLSWQQLPIFGMAWGVLAIIGACLFWAVDNNLTRKISASDASQIAMIKGLAAGITNLALGSAAGGQVPGAGIVFAAGVLGLFGYGISLVLFILALRNLGSARTAAYFSIAPFAGAALALPLLGETPGILFWPASVLMGIGVWLHFSERHEHSHTHEPIRHAHRHVHDEHHQHSHASVRGGHDPHSHEHMHAPITHSHHHFPDMHHRHRH